VFKTSYLRGCIRFKKGCEAQIHMSAKKVIIYTTPTCQHCKRIKEFLSNCKIEYTEFDVSTDPARAAEMIEKTEQMGVPVIDIDGTCVIGFDKQALEKALGVQEE
jgi:glutaredoxin 3